MKRVFVVCHYARGTGKTSESIHVEDENGKVLNIQKCVKRSDGSCVMHVEVPD